MYEKKLNNHELYVSVLMSTVSSTPLTNFSVEDDIHPEVQSCRESVFTPTCTSHPTAIHPLQLSYTPGGSERCTRLVEESFTPKLKMQFVDFDSAMCFFVVYAISCGFEPRLYTTKRTRGGELLRKSILGASISFQQCKEYADGYANVGATLTDFKNFARDVKCYIGLKDATLFVNHLEELAKIKPGFYFAREIDDQKCLSRVFWSDVESRKNYAEFGDAVSFDATYGTNKYGMIFTPFTGVDHHKRSVTFACSLLDHENEDSFTWCFKKFLDCMGQKEPLCIVTDQGVGMLLAIPNVFKTARHRFCMWHIMEKVSSKVGAITCKETDFLSRLHSVVWDSTLEPKKFEEKWLAVMNDFNLVGHKWLSSMYRDKHCWIPAYFRDMPMGGLLRTTQRSESSNSFYKRYQTHFGTLVEFWMRFETAMGQQRYLQKCHDKDSEHSLPVTSAVATKIELHAASVYTHKVFYDVQVELKNTCSCGLAGMPVNGDVRVYDINDELRYSTFQVSYNVATQEVTCSCKLFESKEDCDPADVIKMEISNVWSEFYSTIGVAKSLPVDRIKELAALLKSFREEFSPSSSSEVLSKEKEIEQLLGFTSSSEVTILPPKQVRNKGSGKRLLSSRNESIANAQKPKRLCACCKHMANHDKRNYPQKELDDATSEDDDAV
ncbi:protein FAR1-RELATED SEQUENCE 5-like [Silene latifolia]|uniref:protein FAR1-RELATED SEQUENCE 5-like n=1 Tax=Silene latifolia TaxID=37657 RepID=UPI003D7876FC